MESLIKILSSSCLYQLKNPCPLAPHYPPQCDTPSPTLSPLCHPLSNPFTSSPGLFLRFQQCERHSGPIHLLRCSHTTGRSGHGHLCVSTLDSPVGTICLDHLLLLKPNKRNSLHLVLRYSISTLSTSVLNVPLFTTHDLLCLL
jgi:hypothetical protein